MNNSSRKTVRERAQEVALQAALAKDLMHMMGIDDDPKACRKYLADAAAGDIEKYSPTGLGKYGGLEETLDSPIEPSNQCHFCESKQTGDTKLLQCSACKMVRYCDRECQRKDWKFHKKGCALLQSDPKDLGRVGIS
jgi:hypothetical protein